MRLSLQDLSLLEPLQPHETELSGAWLANGVHIAGDAVCQRIKWLQEHHLKHLATDRSGWDRLYRDTRDGRLWELVYLHSEMHGGGPPTLRVLGREVAVGKYGEYWL